MTAEVSAPILEVLARGAAVGALVGLAIVIARPPFSPARITGILFCLAAAAHNLTQNQVIESVLGPAWPLVWAFSVMGAGLFWAFATELFGDRPRLDQVRFAPAAVLLLLGIAKLMTTGWTADASLLAQHIVTDAVPLDLVSTWA